jgi:4-amino-4-deoxy-L-arabinose transferase-like glycosyltransferase
VDQPIVTRRFLILAAVILLPLYLWAGMGNRDVWAPDEPRYALVAREMQQRGNYVFPTVNGEAYAHKPPLLFWSILASSALTGKDPADGYTARIPSMLAGLGTLAITAKIGAEVFSPAVGATSAVVLATMHLFCWEAHAAQMDAMLTFWIALAILFLVRHRASGRAVHAHGFFLACGLATLSKGPPGFLIPWAVALMWPVGEGESRRRRDLFRPLHLLSFLAPVLFWLGSATAHGGRAYIEELIGKHVVKRYLQSWHHERPWHYFLHDTPKNMVPWSVFLPAVVVFLWDRWKAKDAPRGMRLAVVWILFMLAFFSFPTGKRGVYMLPAFPALALLIGAALEEAAAGARAIRRAVIAGFVLVPVLPVVLMKAMSKGELGGAPADFTAMRWCAAIALALVAIGFYRWTIPHLVRMTVLSTAALFIGIYATVLGQIDKHKSPRAFCELAQSLRKPGEKLTYFGIFLEQYPLFTGERMITAKEAGDFIPLIAGEPSVLTFMQVEFLKELKDRADVSVEVLQERKIGDKNMVLARLTPRQRTARR